MGGEFFMTTLRRWSFCLAFLVTVALGAGTAAAYRTCVTYNHCTSCDLYDQFGNYVGTISWCSYD
jgi:hypothetical protein